jgi:hypothetical protein
MLARVGIDGVVRRVLAKPAKAKPLQMGLHGAHICIGDRTHREIGSVSEQWPQQHLGAQHLIKPESVHDLGLFPECKQDVPDIARKLGIVLHVIAFILYRCGCLVLERRRGFDQRVELFARAAGLDPCREILLREDDDAHLRSDFVQSLGDAGSVILAR